MADNQNTYGIIKINDLGKIDFNDIITTSDQTIRKSNDESLFVINWIEGLTPKFITDGEVIPESILNHDDALILMHTNEWSQPNPTI